MRHALLIVVALVAFAEVATFGQPDGTTGSGLLEQCELMLKTMDMPIAGPGSPTGFDAFKGGRCNGMVHATLQIVRSASNWRTCVPEAVAVEQATRVVIRYLEEHPERLHESDVSLLIRALQDAFPCE